MKALVSRATLPSCRGPAGTEGQVALGTTAVCETYFLDFHSSQRVFAKRLLLMERVQNGNRNLKRISQLF